MQHDQPKWNWVIRPETSWLGSSIRELFQYRDLLGRLVRKEFLLRYQQTLLGPVWVIIQPLLTVLVYVVVFNRVIGIPTGGVPPMLFYLTGITLWNLFSDIFNGTSTTFVTNAHIFQKVYFPRVIAPLSIVLLHLSRFGIQMGFLVAIYLYFLFKGEVAFSGWNLFYMLPSIVIVAGTGLGAGLLFSILTAKYRDFSNIIGMITSLLMFICPIFYTLAIVPEKIKWFVNLNPLSGQFELFRKAVLNIGDVSIYQFAYGFGFMVLILMIGILLFNKLGDKLMDVI